ncbi:MAG: ABC transporter substrate-binding protein [Alteromonas sp.]|nr:ABC transporter substrate-binding protein [Alteromonas sp.]MAY21808.1 ABC transporter substrate-binding protein [Flavobacteriaceae bacterium]|tara:strand:+ start:29617 stop:30471 length:855 start_codon:yes stop_codon:yes gene_type:complete
MKTIHIGGVPEHFNLPWYLTLRNKEYHEKDINLRWKDYYGGTGEMCKALRNKEIDMAVILTEGIIRDISNGNDCKIVQVFVESPLIWGIHVAKNSSYESVSDLKGTKAAISRYGSGSHLMAYIHAENNGWDPETDLSFEVIKDLKGALEGLPEGRGDYFMWEKFTTKPYVDDGPFRLVGECPTPWPCFVIAVRNDVLESHAEAIQDILQIINETTVDFKEIPSIDQMIANRYEQKLEDVQSWLSLTKWSQKNLDTKEVDVIQGKLLQLDLISEKKPSEEILYFF